MFWTLSLFAFSFAVAVVLTPLWRDLALRKGWLDRPDQKRKLHRRPIPRVGGVPLVLAYAVSLALIGLIARGSILLAEARGFVLWGLLGPALLIFAIGLLDDLFTLRPYQKLAVETLAALLAYAGGTRIHELFSCPIPSFLALPLTVGWLLACTNAFNLIDGLDGLATGIGLIATLTTLVAGLLGGEPGLVLATAPLAGALFGFLLYNFHPASIFLGDGGSLWIGFMLACYGVIWSQKSVTIASITAPLMALSIPLLDTALAIARRFLRRQSIFTADRGHIHHRLLDQGLTPLRAALLLYGTGIIGSGFALSQSAGPWSARALLVAAFCLLVWVGIRYLGYREFALAANLLRRNTLRRMLQSDYSMQAYARSLASAETVDDCWRTIRAAAREFGFTSVQLVLGGKRFEEHFSDSPHQQWWLNVPVSDSDYVLLRYPYEMSSAALAIGPLADLLHQCLSAKANVVPPQRSLTVAAP